MKTQDFDNELKSLIKEVKLDSPGNDFTLKVMNRIYEEKVAMEKVKDEKILGKGFWVILSLFVLLIAAMFVFSSMGAEADGPLSKLLGGVKDGIMAKGVQSFFGDLGTIPLSVGGILLAASVLVLIDRFLPEILPGNANLKLHS